MLTETEAWRHGLPGDPEIWTPIINMQNNEHIAQSVRIAMEQYFRDLDGEAPSAIYDMVLACVEKPLLEVVLIHTQGNQTRAAELLGLNRNTLRKKMKSYDLI